MNNTLIAVLIAIPIVGLIGWNFWRWYIFEKDYAFTGSFEGTAHEIPVGGINQEALTYCLVGADKNGLYLLANSRPTNLVGDGYDVFKKSLFIPWADIVYYSKNLFLKECMWFTLTRRRVYLYVPKDMGLKLLTEAGLPLPKQR